MTVEDGVAWGEEEATGEPEGVALSLSVAEAHTVEDGEREGEEVMEALALAVRAAVGLSLALALPKEVPEAAPLAETVASLLVTAEALRVGTSEGALVTAAEEL